MGFSEKCCFVLRDAFDLHGSGIRQQPADLFELSLEPASADGCASDGHAGNGE